jgi:O-antigen/teichoic acid export membrane protein
LGDEELGVFSAGYYLVSLSMVFFTLFSNSLNSYTHNFKKKNFKNSKLISTVFFITFIGIITNYFFGESILILFFSKNYENSVNVFTNFSPYLLIICFKPIIDKLLIYRGQRKILAFRNFFLLIFNSLIVFVALFYRQDYKLIPYVLFMSEFLAVICYYLNFETRYIFNEIVYGVFKIKIR